MAISVVQSTSAQGANVSSITTPAISSTTGNLVHVLTTWYTGVAEPALSDTSTLTFTNLDGPNDTAGGSSQASHERYSNGITGNANHTFTATQAGQYMSIAVMEVAGQDATAPLDQHNSQLNGGGTTAGVSPDITTTQNDELLIGSATDTDIFTTRTYSCTTPWTQREQKVISPGGNFAGGHVTGSQVLTATGAHHFTIASSVNISVINAARVYVSSWKAAAAGSAIKTINGLALASVKTVNGLAIASVKTVNGLA